MILAELLVGLALAGSDFDHDYTALDRFYGDAVSARGVDYDALATRRAQLDEAIAAIADAPVDEFTASQQLALYVNAYNAYTLATVLDARPLKSIMDIDGGKVWDTRKFRVAGRDLTLNQIEHGNVRRLGNGRIHAAVNCASKGCPPLPPDPLRGSTSEAQLDAAARTWAATNAYRIEGGTVYLSSIFDWYADDFPARGDIPGVDGKAEAALWFLSDFVGADAKARLTGGGLTAAWQSYDWSLNAR